MQLQLHKVIERERKSKGLTLNGLAKKTGLPLSSLHGWVAKRPPSGKNLTQLLKLAEFFSITLTALLFDTEESQKTTKVLFRSEFADERRKYRLVVERLDD